MNRFKGVSKALTWSMASLLVALVAGCGGGGSADPDAFGPGSNVPGTVRPGFATCAAAGAQTPKVTSSIPTDQNPGVTTSTGVIPGKSITANFSLAMNPATINTTTFTLAPAAGTALVSLDASGTVATLTTSLALQPDTSYTARITQGAMSAGATGTALACIYTWTFRTVVPPAPGPAPVVLGAAAPFGGFGGGAGMTNSGNLTVITGAQGQPVSIGSTGVSTGMTGFHDTAGCTYTEVPNVNVGRVDGTINTAAPPPGGPPICLTTEGNATTAAAAQAGADAALAAWTDLRGRTPATVLPSSQLGGLTLAPGIYTNGGGAFFITGPADLTLDAGGDPDAVWVFQMTGALTVGTPARANSVILAGGAQPKNVFWQVGSAATINGILGGGTMVGTIIAPAGVTISTAAVTTITTLNGRALGLNASVTMVNTVINVPAP